MFLHVLFWSRMGSVPNVFARMEIKAIIRFWAILTFFFYIYINTQLLFWTQLQIITPYSLHHPFGKTTINTKLSSPLTGTYSDSPSCSPPLGAEAPSSGSLGLHFPCHWMESHRHLQASSLLDLPLGFPRDESWPLSLASFCPSPPDVKKSFQSSELEFTKRNTSSTCYNYRITDLTAY